MDPGGGGGLRRVLTLLLTFLRPQHKAAANWALWTFGGELGGKTKSR